MPLPQSPNSSLAADQKEVKLAWCPAPALSVCTTTINPLSCRFCYESAGWSECIATTMYLCRLLFGSSTVTDHWLIMSSKVVASNYWCWLHCNILELGYLVQANAWYIAERANMHCHRKACSLNFNVCVAIELLEAFTTVNYSINLTRLKICVNVHV